MTRLFIIGNGFDLSHDLPTSFDPDFKKIAELYGQSPCFWDLYQSREANIWADFENLLAHPDYNELLEIFDGFQSEYFSDRESDRTAGIIQGHLNGKLEEELDAFANQAEAKVPFAKQKSEFTNLFIDGGLFVSFNYTHTLEEVYGIPKNRVLHIHGEVGQKNLIIGYPEGSFAPDKFFIDLSYKDRGPYREIDFREYVRNGGLDPYIDIAYSDLIAKVESFSKAPQIQKLENFLLDLEICEVYVLGHSCAIDFPYFDYLNKKYSKAHWKFSAFNEPTRKNIEKLVDDIGIERYQISA